MDARITNIRLTLTVLALLAALSALFAACGGDSTKLQPGPDANAAPGASVLSDSIPASELAPLPVDPPELSELRNYLSAEFERLGIDPDRVSAQAPSGIDNAAFDLVVSYQSTYRGATLHWTERMVGDYDMNGEVNAADLTPIAQRWKYTIDFRPEAEAGVRYWPLGNPRNGGFSGVLNGFPGWDTPADQWRTARVDGDGNGEINIADTTPIAQRWKEQLDSYRIYRRSPGETEFSMLRLDITDDYSLRRSAYFPKGKTAPDNLWPYRLHYADVTVSEGTYEYYLTPYDSVNDHEGTPSPVVSITYDNSNPPPPPPDNQPPVISVIADVEKGDAPLFVNFDASASTDPDGEIVLYVWDWEGDGQVDATSQNSPLGYHTYEKYGWYYPTLTIWDDQGGSDTATIDIEVGVSDNGHFPPRVELLANPPSGPRPLTVTFTADIIVDDGDFAGLSYEWDFNDNGSVDSTDSPLPDGVQHQYIFVGPQTARLTVSDAKGLSTSVTTHVDVTVNADPLAVLTSDPLSGDLGLLVSFDASASTDPDGDPLTYRWDFDGDGKFETDGGTNPLIQHVYGAEGEFDAAVKVWDPAGASSVASVHVSIIDTNLPPVAVLTVEHNPVPAGFEFYVDAYDSYDDDGSILKWRFDMDNDGTYEYQNGTLFRHTYVETGTYTVHLQVEDNDGATGDEYIDVVVFDNLPPTAELLADPVSGAVPLEVNFDASGSTDPDGDVLSFAWDFNYNPGDNQYKRGEALASNTYGTIGERTCRVRVRDPWFAESFAEAAISTSGPGWYVVQVDTGYADNWSPDIGLELVDGRPALAYGSSSTGTYGGDGDMRYCRAADELGISWNEPVVIYHPLSAGLGIVGPSLSVIAGYPCLAWARHSGEVYFCRGTESGGSSWASPVQVYVVGGTGSGTDIMEINGNPALCWVDALSYLRFSRSDNAQGSFWPDVQQIERLTTVGGFNYQAEMVMVNGSASLAYAKKELSSSSIRYRWALDDDATAWTPAIDVYQPNNSTPGVSLTTVGGNPVVAYYCELGLVFQIAPDGVGNSWLGPVVISPEGGGNGSWTSFTAAEICIVELNGVPAVLDSQMGLWVADNALGTSWTGPEHIPDGYSGRTFALLDVDGNPAIAFQDLNVFYAIKLP
jgi:PKD repeat protein